MQTRFPTNDWIPNRFVVATAPKRLHIYGGVSHQFSELGSNDNLFPAHLSTQYALRHSTNPSSDRSQNETNASWIHNCAIFRSVITWNGRGTVTLIPWFRRWRCFWWNPSLWLHAARVRRRCHTHTHTHRLEHINAIALLFVCKLMPASFCWSVMLCFISGPFCLVSTHMKINSIETNVAAK